MRTVLFGSLDAGPSTFLNVGAKVALDDVDREGFVALVSAGSGARQERGPPVRVGNRSEPVTPTIVRVTALGAVLGGYQVFADWGVVGLFAGPEGTIDALTDGAGLQTRPPRFGLRLQGEVWARLSPDTLATGTLVLGSARWDLYGRVSLGYRAWGAYLGPEASVYGDRTDYRKLSLGLHATDFSFAGMSLRVSGGCLYESETDRFGPYVALAAWAPL